MYRMLFLILFLTSCVPNGHYAGGFARGLGAGQSVGYHHHLYSHAPLPVRYYGQPHVDRYDAGRDPWLAENDPWVVQ